MLEAKKKLPAIFKAFAAMGADFVPEGEYGTDIDKAIQEQLESLRITWRSTEWIFLTS
jgi:hypothetical protein